MCWHVRRLLSHAQISIAPRDRRRILFAILLQRQTRLYAQREECFFASVCVQAMLHFVVFLQLVIFCCVQPLEKTLQCAGLLEIVNKLKTEIFQVLLCPSSLRPIRYVYVARINCSGGHDTLFEAHSR